jgi:hypothetical protein
MADNLDPEIVARAALSPWAWGVIGGIAGTIARSSDWWTEKNGFLWRTFVADMSASGALVILAVLAADYMHMPPQYAAGFASMLALVGVQPLRAGATRVLDFAVTMIGRRIGGTKE